METSGATEAVRNDRHIVKKWWTWMPSGHCRTNTRAKSESMALSTAEKAIPKTVFDPSRRWKIHCAVPAVRNGHMRKDPGKDSTARGAPKGWRLEKRWWKGRECNNGIRNHGPKDQLCLRMRTSDRNFSKPAQLEMENLVVGYTSEVQGVNYWTFWKIKPQPKCKEELWTV
jgi:hypothetical protein